MSTPITPRVSIIVRTKDRPVLLGRALDDLLAQEFEEWEAIVINDGGDREAVDALVQVRPSLSRRATVIHNTSSLGMESASNVGVERSSGEFIVVHDDDDTWAPDFLAAAVEWLDLNPEDVAVSVGTEIVLERIHGGTVTELDRMPFTSPHDIVTTFDLLISNRVVPIALLMRASVLRELGGFDSSLPVVGDWEMNLRLALHGRIGHIPKPVRAFWHQRPAASGDLANSVHGAKDLHGRYDRVVRERELRAYAAKHGIGGLLYLTKFVDERIAADERHTYERVREAAEAHQADVQRLEANIQQLEKRLTDAIRYYSLGATVRRALARLRRRGS